MIRSIDLDGTEKKVANRPIGYYSDENHTTWKSVVKVAGDDKGGGIGAYSILRIKDKPKYNLALQQFQCKLSLAPQETYPR